MHAALQNAVLCCMPRTEVGETNETIVGWHGSVRGKPEKPSGRYPKGMKTPPNHWRQHGKPKQRKRKGLGALMG